MWHPSDGQIYFWRIVPLGNFRYTIGLYRISPDGGEPELVRDLTAQFAAQIPLYDYERLFLDGVSAISPDGNTVAALMTRVNDMGGTEQSLWTHRPRRCQGRTPGAGRRRGLPQRDPRVGAGLPAAGARPVLDRRRQGHRRRGQHGAERLRSPSRSTTMSTCGRRHHAGRRLQRAGGDGELLRTGSRQRPALACLLALDGSLSPAGDKLLMVNDLGGTVALFTAPLPPTGDLPVVSASADESPIVRYQPTPAAAKAAKSSPGAYC